jgi:hypothetical protein
MEYVRVFNEVCTVRDSIFEIAKSRRTPHPHFHPRPQTPNSFVMTAALLSDDSLDAYPRVQHVELLPELVSAIISFSVL